MLSNMYRKTINTAALAGLCALASAGANAQVFNHLDLISPIMIPYSASPTIVDVFGTASSDSNFVDGILQDQNGIWPTVDSWNTSLTTLNTGTNNSGTNVLLAVYTVPGGTAPGTYKDDLYFDSGSGTADTQFRIIVGPATPEPGNVAMLTGLGLSGAGFLIRRRRSK